MTAEPAQSALANLLTLADAVGVRFWARDGGVHYRSPEGAMTPDLIERVKANKGELLGWLTVWDGAEALQLEFEADGMVERSGVSGRDAVIDEQAGLCAVAHLAHDMTGVREACARIEDRVRKVIQQQQKGAA